MAKQQVNMRLDPELHQKARIEAIKRGYKSFTSFIEAILEREILRGKEA